MTSASTRAKYQRRSPLALPNLGPWAGILLLLCFVFMSAGRLADPAPLIKLPMIHWFPVCKLEENYILIISIDAKRQAYLAIEDSPLQTAVIRQVAKHHKITFTADQLEQLQKMPFFSQDIQRLPAWLSASGVKRQQFPKGIPASSSNDQLSEYVATSISESLALYGRPIHIKFRADESLPAADVKHVMQLLQKQGINYFSFVAERGQYISLR